MGIVAAAVVLGAIYSMYFSKAILGEVTAMPVQPSPKAMSVEIAIIEARDIRLWKEFSGRLTAVDYVEIRPQTTGIIKEVKFEDGQMVSKGDILYIIDTRSLKARVAQMQASLLAAQNSFSLASKEYVRAKDLLARKMISQQFYDSSINTKLLAESSVKQAEAELSIAKIDLSHAYVKAPVSGRVSRAELTVGNLVSDMPERPLLTTIVSLESIYADFEVDEQTYIDYVDRDSVGKMHDVKNPVELSLQNSDERYQGIIHAFDNRIDPASGTIRARAIFDNPKGKLLPGMYAHLKLGSATKQNEILISERAIATDQNRKFVYLVNAENKTTYREVQLGDSINGDRIILSGLEEGDKVIVRGLMKVQPNMLVDPNVSMAEEIKTVKH